MHDSLRSKRFHVVSEQWTRNKSQRPCEKWRIFYSCSISLSVKAKNPLPLSFFAPKPNGNACYAGYVHDKGYRVYAFLLYTKYKRKQLWTFVLLTAIVTLLAILTIQHGIILPQHLLQKHKKLNEKRSNYSKSRACLSMETITLANKAGVSYRYKLLGS